PSSPATTSFCSGCTLQRDDELVWRQLCFSGGRASPTTDSTVGDAHPTCLHFGLATQRPTATSPRRCLLTAGLRLVGFFAALAACALDRRAQLRNFCRDAVEQPADKRNVGR